MKNKAGELEDATGMGAFFTKAGPDMIELLENTAVMAALTKVTGPKSFWNSEVKGFIIQDLIVELGFGKMLEDNGIRIFKLREEGKSSWKTPITKEQYNSYFPSEPELKSAANKWLYLAITDTVYRFLFKQPQMSSQRFMYSARVYGALVGGNVIEKGISKRKEGEEASYRPR
uniref:Uncharacterized protein n=1 Tax=uncultured marine group II/III euryarchaeote AD1000_39_G05 TaxID=1457764 RepID=A0A075FR14_9EURY|nr:hypothetical protein [uncultured marine group II/III euryarchaeote AD1000_39_G05]